MPAPALRVPRLPRWSLPHRRLVVAGCAPSCWIAARAAGRGRLSLGASAVRPDYVGEWPVLQLTAAAVDSAPHAACSAVEHIARSRADGRRSVVEAIIGPRASRLPTAAFYADLEDYRRRRFVFSAPTPSPISVISIGVACSGRRLVGLHFFNPAPLMALVEVLAFADAVA